MGKEACKAEKTIGRFHCRLFQNEQGPWISMSHVSGTRLFLKDYNSFTGAKAAYEMMCQIVSDVVACTAQDIKGEL